MDKVKIKNEVTEIKMLIDELIAENKLDGDKGKAMLEQFIQSSISREIQRNEGVA